MKGRDATVFHGILGFFAVGLICLLMSLSSIALAFEVPLTITNNNDFDRNAEPVTVGIPIPYQYGVTDSSLLRIVDESGLPVPSQFLITARWGASPSDTTKPIKWVLTTFLATIPANHSAEYRLVSGEETTVFTDMEVTENADDFIIINTGSATFTLDKKKFVLFNQVVKGSDVITASDQNGFFLTDENGNLYSTVNDKPKLFQVEEKGPTRVVIKVEGSLRDSSSVPILDYRTYLYFYRGKSYVRVLFMLGNHNKAKVGTNGKYDVYDYFGGNSVTFKSLSCYIHLKSQGETLAYLFPSKASKQKGTIHGRLNIYQDSSGTDFWANYTSDDNPRPTSYCRFRGYKVMANGQTIDAGDSFEGWVDCSTNSIGMAAGIVNFWKEFPKALSVDDNGTIRVGLFPDEYSGLYNFRVGEEKTSEFFLYFHQGDASRADSSSISGALLNPMVPMAPFEWYQSSRAIQETVKAEDPKLLYARLYDQLNGDFFKLSLAEMYDYYNDRTIVEDTRYNGPYSTYYPFHSLWKSSDRYPSSRDYFNFFGSLGCGYGNLPLDYESYDDKKAGPFNCKYNIDYGAWLQFLRKGDSDWLEMAQALSRYSEQLMLNDVITETGWDIERWKNAVFGHAEHNETGNLNGQRNYLGPVLDTSFGAPGALLCYYLTGYPVSKTFLQKLVDYTYDFYMQNGIPRYTRGGDYENFVGREITAGGPEGINPPIRELANVINHLTAGLLLTGDKKYHELISGIIHYYYPDPQKDEWKWLNGPDPSKDPTLYVNEWNLVMYLHALGGYISALHEFGMEAQEIEAEEIFMKFVNWMRDFGLGQYDPYDYRDYTYIGIYYPYWYLDGHTPQENTLICNWEYATADVFAYAYKYTNDIDYLVLARQLFFCATMNEGYPGDTLTYMTAKEAVNAAVYGHIYLYYADLAEMPPDPVLNQPPVAEAGSDITAQEGDSFVLDGSHSFDPDGDTLQFEWSQDPRDPIQLFLENPYLEQVPLEAPQVPDGNDTLTLHFTLSVSDGINPEAQDSVTVYVTRHDNLPVEGTRLVLQQGTLLSSGITYQGATDAYIRFDSFGNYGASEELIAYNSDSPAWRFLLRFDLSGLKELEGSHIESAWLYLTRKRQAYGASKRVIYRLNHAWKEGSGHYGETTDGVTWDTYDGINAWERPGGDYDDRMIASGTEVAPSDTEAVESYDITPLVQGWIDGTIENNGIIVTIPEQYYYSASFYHSSESQDVSSRPRLELEFSKPSSQNLLLNPDFGMDLEYWNNIWAMGKVENEDGNKVFVLEQGHLVQDVDLAVYSEAIDMGKATLLIKGNLRTADASATDGHPYIRCIIFGTQEDSNTINTYINTEVVSTDTWKKVETTVPIPRYSRRVRIYLKKSLLADSKSSSPHAYFDDLYLGIRND